MSAMRKPRKRELEIMLEQIDSKDYIAVFNAKKALYIYVDDSFLGKMLLKLITFWLKRNLRGINNG